MAASDVRAGRAYVEVFLKNGQLLKGLASMQQHFKALGSGLTSIGMKMMAGGSGVTGALALMTKKFTEAGDAAAKMAQRTGMTAESISQLTFAAEASGITIEDVEAGFRKFQKTLGDTVSGSPDEQLEKLADSIAAIEDPTERANAAMTIFGKSGTKLLPMLEGGAKGLREMKQKAIDLGVAMDDSAIQAAEDMDDAMDDLTASAKGLSKSIGSALAPMLTELAKVSTACVVSFSKFIRQHGDLVRSVLKGAAAVVAGGAAAFVLGKMFLLASGAIAFLTPAIVALATPLGLVVGLVIGGAAAWLKWSDNGKKAVRSVSSAFIELGDIATSTWGSIVDAVSGGDLALAGEVATAGLLLAWQQCTGDVQKLWANTKNQFLTDWNFASGELAKFFVTAFGEVQKSWAGAMGFFKTAWNGLNDIVSKSFSAWTAFSEGLAIGFLKSAGVINDTMAELLLEASNKDFEKRNKAITAGTVGTQAGIDATTAGTVSDIDKKTAAMASTLAEDRKRAQDTLDSDLANDIAGRQKTLDDARARLAAAKSKTDAMAAARKGLGLGDDAEELRRRGGGVSGSFFAAALTGMGGGGVQERIAKTNEKQLSVQQQQLAALNLLAGLINGLQTRVTE